MRDVIVHDRRLSGTPNWGNCVRRQVNESTRIGPFITDLINISNQSQGINRLKIMCHGWADQIGNLGFGLQFCAEGITPATVGLFRQLHPAGQPPKVRFIEVYACGAAARTEADREPSRMILGGFRTPGANGEQLMRNLAINSGAFVKASTHTQYYNINLLGQIDFGAWEGRVTTWNPTGEPIFVEVNPTEPS